MPFLITLQAAFQHLWLRFTVILEPIPAGQRARDYLNLYVKPTLLAGLTALCKEKPADPMVCTAYLYCVVCSVTRTVCIRKVPVYRKATLLLELCAVLATC